MRYALTSILLLLSISTINCSGTQTNSCSSDNHKNDRTCQNKNKNKNKNNKKNSKKDHKLEYRDECRFYLAPSSIPNAGFGIYTTQSIDPDTPITQVADAPSIILTDVTMHNQHRKDSDSDSGLHSNSNSNLDPEEDSYPTLNWNHHDYFWDGTGSGEFEAATVEESVVTFGALCNYHTYLKNVKPLTAEYDDHLTPRNFNDNSDSGSVEYGMGAYSYQSGYQFYASRRIEEGEEIFCDYGEEWLDGRPALEGVAREEEFETAAKLVKKVVDGLQSGDVRDGEHGDSDGDSDGDGMTQNILNIVNSIVQHFAPRVSNVLPTSKETFQSLQDIISSSDATQSKLSTKGNVKEKDADSETDLDPDPDPIIQQISHQLAQSTITSHAHPISWIQSNGKCLDNLIPQTSTLDHAGRGAFAQRFVKKGESVVPAPLLMMMDYRTLDIWDYGVDYGDDANGHDDVDNDDDVMLGGGGGGYHGDGGEPFLYQHYDHLDDEHEHEDDEDKEVPRGTQLIMNYCLSHPETSMVMCPQTNSILINHCSHPNHSVYAMNYGGDCSKYNENEDESLRGPNAKMVWAIDSHSDVEFGSSAWDPDTEAWLKLTVEEIDQLVSQGKRGLSMDIIATRDIYPGEEVFIDYGLGWEEDWADHVETFIPPTVEGDHDYMPIAELNAKMEKLRTPHELEKDMYPKNARLTCIYWVGEGNEAVDEHSPLDNDTMDWENGDGSIFVEENELYKMYGYSWNCRVLERNERNNEIGVDSNTTYTVELFTTSAETTIWSETGRRRILHDYPRKSMKFVPKRYSSDQHIIGAFRSYIRIPDEIFPEQWKDVEA